jgi:membrane protease YdiL (CAAX protease family)
VNGGSDVDLIKPVSIDSTVKFVLLAYALTWFGSAVVFSGRLDAFGPAFLAARTLLLLLGSFAPSVAAVGITASEEGVPGLRALLRGLIHWHVAPRWYVLAILYPFAILSSVEIAHRGIAGAWLPLRAPLWFAIAGSTILRNVVRASEEVGWRGYALPRLTERFGLRKASLILGPIWALWHLPAFFIPGRGAYVQTLPTFVLEVTALSVVFAWLYAKSDGSLLPVILMHSAIDEVFSVLLPPPGAPPASPFAFSAELVPWLIIAFAWLTAAYCLVRMGSGTEFQGRTP